ncbi:MAG: DUF1249 domain-containing protein [Methylococcales bacterium]|nr:DUF1249 domain-containing protein [Methylococcales bacterium]
MTALHPVNKPHCLHKLCESNYHRLLRLVPSLHQLERSATAKVAGKPTLYLSLLEKAPFTLTLELSHCFDEGMKAYFEPAVKVRVYLDAQAVEVVHDNSRPAINHAFRHYPGIQKTLDYKWALNYFLEKWLHHCLGHGYHFNSIPTQQADCLDNPSIDPPLPANQ